MESQFARMKLGTHRMSATNGQTLPDDVRIPLKRRFRIMPTVRPERLLGRMGCYISHLDALRMAIELEWDNVLIVEDDCTFLKGAERRNFTVPQDCDVFYLGGLFWRQKAEPTLQTGPWVHIDREYLKIACCLCYGIMGKSTIRRIYTTLMESRPATIDMMYVNVIQKKGHCYILNPVLCSQDHSFESDVSSIGGPPPKYVKKTNAYYYRGVASGGCTPLRRC
jgi:GR25 family glycosyltransferase involved in LPS biosynthesis